jgi:hypothetical protein
MSVKTFEVTLRIELETVGKTEPTKADAYDALAEAVALYGTRPTVCTAAMNDIRIDSVEVTDDFTDLYYLA